MAPRGWPIGKYSRTSIYDIDLHDDKKTLTTPRNHFQSYEVCVSRHPWKYNDPTLSNSRESSAMTNSF